MIVVNRIGDGKNISVTCRDKEFNVLYTKDRFKKLLKISEKSMEVTSMDELNKLLEQVEVLCANDYQEKVESFHPELTYQPATEQYYLKLNSKISKIPLPSALVWRIEESMDKGISVDPIIKFWKRALRNKKADNPDFMRRLTEYINMTYVNPEKVAEYMEAGLNRELAKEKATTYEVQITQEGLIACYKTSDEYLDKFEEDEDGNIVKVPRYKTKKTFDPDTGKILSESDGREDIAGEDRIFIPHVQKMLGDAFYCEGPKTTDQTSLGHFIRIGHVHRLPDWSFVNCNDRESCVKGLHIGGLSYIARWNGADIHTCFVDPMHIGAIPDYAGDKAIRVLQYFVYGSLVTLNHNIYHSSGYAKQTDSEWASIAKEIIEKHGELKTNLNEEIEDLKAL